MAGRLKHMLRSHRSHHNGIPMGMFANKAAVAQEKKARQNFFERFFHRSNDK